MRKAVLFLNGRYRAQDIPTYRKLARGRFKVAVDGGYLFFGRSGLVPDLLIGDFDSLKKLPGKLPTKTRVVRFPSDKDKTDTELALDYCLDQGITQIDLVQPSLGDADHFLANLFLLTRASRLIGRKKVSLRLVGPGYEVFLVSDGRIGFRRAGGSVVSVVPVSGAITLTCRGTAFNVTRAGIARGRTRATRNRIMAVDAWFEVAGKAFVIRHFPRPK